MPSDRYSLLVRKVWQGIERETGRPPCPLDGRSRRRVLPGRLRWDARDHVLRRRPAQGDCRVRGSRPLGRVFARLQRGPDPWGSVAVSFTVEDFERSEQRRDWNKRRPKGSIPLLTDEMLNDAEWLRDWLTAVLRPPDGWRVAAFEHGEHHDMPCTLTVVNGTREVKYRWRSTARFDFIGPEVAHGGRIDRRR